MTMVRMVDSVQTYFQGVRARFEYRTRGFAIVGCWLADNMFGEDVIEALMPIEPITGQCSFIA